MVDQLRGRVLVLLSVLGLAVTVAACAGEGDVDADTEPGDDIVFVKDDQLTTCSNLPYEPFEFSKNGEPVGFDVDLGELIADELDVEHEFFNTSFEGIESGVAFDTHQCDIAAAAMTITDDRAEGMEFSDGYFDANQALAVRKGSNIEGLDQLRGQVLGVQQGTTGEEHAEENQGEHGYTTNQYEDLALMETALKNGEIDAAINDNTVLFESADDNEEIEIVQEIDTGEQYGLAVRDGNGALLDKVNEILEEAKEDGRYEEIYEEWFDRKPDTTP